MRKLNKIIIQRLLYYSIFFYNYYNFGCSNWTFVFSLFILVIKNVDTFIYSNNTIFNVKHILKIANRKLENVCLLKHVGSRCKRVDSRSPLVPIGLVLSSWGKLSFRRRYFHPFIGISLDSLPSRSNVWLNKDSLPFRQPNGSSDHRTCYLVHYTTFWTSREQPRLRLSSFFT